MRTLPKLIAISILRSLGGISRLVGRRSTNRFNRIAVIRFGGIGDVIVVTGLVRSIRQKFPDASIDVITCAPFGRFFFGIPNTKAIELAVPIYWRGGLRGISRSMRAAWSLRKIPYDAIIHCHNGIEYLAFALMWRHPRIIGFETNKNFFGFALTDKVHIFSGPHPMGLAYDGRPVNDQFHDLLRCLVPSAANHRPSLPEWERAEARKILQSAQIALLIGGTDPLKRWSTDNFRRIAVDLYNRGFKIVVLGGRKECQDGDIIARGVGCSHCGLSLFKAFEILGSCDLAIGNDTGAMHAAYALNVKTLGIFGPTPPSVYGYSEGKRHITLFGDGYTRPLPNARYSGFPINSVEPARVVSVALSMLAENGVQNE